MNKHSSGPDPTRKLNCCFIRFLLISLPMAVQTEGSGGWGGGGAAGQWRRLCWVFIYPGKSNRCRSAVGEVLGSMEGFKKPWRKIDAPHMLLTAAWPRKRENYKETPVYCGKITPPTHPGTVLAFLEISFIVFCFAFFHPGSE